MKRVVVLGPGGSGKSTFARELSVATGIPCTELDSVFWSADLQPTPPWLSTRLERSCSWWAVHGTPTGSWLGGLRVELSCTCHWQRTTGSGPRSATGSITVPWHDAASGR